MPEPVCPACSEPFTPAHDTHRTGTIEHYTIVCCVACGAVAGVLPVHA